METKRIIISHEVFEDLTRIKEDFDAVMESLELMADKAFMESHEKAKNEIKNRDFADWNEL